MKILPKVYNHHITLLIIFNNIGLFYINIDIRSVQPLHSCLTNQVLNISSLIFEQITLPWGPSIISRAGRASPSASWLTDCCPQGVKSVVNPTESPEPTEYSVCTEECCAGLEENTVTMEDGTLYTYCIDEVRSQ